MNENRKYRGMQVELLLYVQSGSVMSLLLTGSITRGLNHTSNPNERIAAVECPCSQIESVMKDGGER